MTTSVAMCTYNGARFIEEQLDSILNQSLPIDEIVICDDGSTDETIEIIQKTVEIKNEFVVRDMPGKSTILDLAEGNYIHTPSVLYRRYLGIHEQYQKMMPCLPGDYVIWMLLAERGDIYKFDEPMAVYRYGSGMWSDKQNDTNLLLQYTNFV